MAYRYEKNQNGDTDLVIDGFENGIADSPFSGIGNMRNVNISYYKGILYVNYKRKPATITGTAINTPRSYCVSPFGIIYILDANGNIYKQDSVNGSSFTQLTGNPGSGNLGIQWWNNYLFVFAASRIDICGDGTGDSGITSSHWNPGIFPLTTQSPVLASPGGTGSGTLTSSWTGATGSYVGYSGALRTGYRLIVNVENGSNVVSWTPGVPLATATTLFLFPMAGNSTSSTPNGGFAQSLVSRNDGILYFCNSAQVGSFSVNDFQTIFTPSDATTFNFNAAALSLPITETATWLEELVSNLIVGTKNKLYPWDRFSPQWQNPLPLPEQLSSSINIMNNLYLLCGNKGNVYISNGYSVSLFKKIPDYIAGTIDPVWQFGGSMNHRKKLFFNALATNSQTNVNILAGIFSLDPDTQVLTMEAQNSFGLVSNSTAYNSLLIDNPSFTLNPASNTAYDSYYSAWTDSTSGIDYNDTTLWSSNEPVIETDIIPIGTFAQSKTFASFEFKFDEPLKSGDSITVYARNSLSDSYSQIGTTTTALLSDFYQPLNFQKYQWVQFKVTMSCNATASNSSFNRLREIRIR